jgi:hypothetical protein
MKFKEEFYNSLIQQLDPQFVDFWQIQPNRNFSGVIRTRAMDDRVTVIYLIIHTFDYNETNPHEWLRFNVIGDKYELDSIYSKYNMWRLPDADEYRYTVDENRDIIATYKYLTKYNVVSIGEPVGEQTKNREKSYYVLGEPITPPETVIRFEGVECDHLCACMNWIDSDGDTHWLLTDDFLAKYNQVCFIPGEKALPLPGQKPESR